MCPPQYDHSSKAMILAFPTAMVIGQYLVFLHWCPILIPDVPCGISIIVRGLQDHFSVPGSSLHHWFCGHELYVEQVTLTVFSKALFWLLVYYYLTTKKVKNQKKTIRNQKEGKILSKGLIIRRIVLFQWWSKSLSWEFRHTFYHTRFM